MLHRRAMISARNKNDCFIREWSDVGYAWESKWEDEPQVVKEVARLKKKYDVVQVTVRDAA